MASSSSLNPDHSPYHASSAPPGPFPPLRRSRRLHRFMQQRQLRRAGHHLPVLAREHRPQLRLPWPRHLLPGEHPDPRRPIQPVQGPAHRLLQSHRLPRRRRRVEHDLPTAQFQLSVDPNSWLQLTPSNSNLTFLYSCKANVSRPSAVRLAGCPEPDTAWYVLRDDGVTTANSPGYACDEAVVTPVLSLHRLANPSLAEVLSDGFEMRYDAKSEQCGACEKSGGRCSYGRTEEHSGTEFACLCDDGANERQCGM
uniref:Uncharacterized protein n=1 Tax=Avena sativa TaxID=4498 RepID=A0ACD5VG01_AVESA